MNGGSAIQSVVDLERPQGEFSLSFILEHTRDLFILSAKHRALRLRGQMIPLEGGQFIAFLCSPWLPEPGAFKEAGISLNDFPLHDPMPELVQVIQTHRLTAEDLRRLTSKLQQQRLALKTANEKILEQSKEFQKLALIASNTHNAVIVTDAHGRVEWINDAFTRITGYTLDEMLGKTPGSILQGPDTDVRVVEAIREQLRRGVGFTCELLNYAKDGRKYWVAIEVQPIHDEASQLTNFMAIESDVTARKEEEARRILGHTVTSLLAEATETDETITAILETICRAIGAVIACALARA